MNYKSIVVLIWGIIFSIACFAQDDFDIQAYEQYLSDNVNMSARELLDTYPSPSTYYSDLGGKQPASSALFMDSVIAKYELTDDELELLNDNHFVVTERLRFESQGDMFLDIYNKDLPVFLSTDAILYAIHTAYDNILKSLEYQLLNPLLGTLLENMYNAIPDLVEQHPGPELQSALADMDLYVSIAWSLYNQQQMQPKTGWVTNFEQVWTAIEAEQAVNLPLFSERDRDIDFSQFTVRGHYVKSEYEDIGLEGYFQTMMWLGRIEFFLTAPPANPWETLWEWDEIKRMAQTSLLMNELLSLSDGWSKLAEINEMIAFFTGESDNLTPSELESVNTENNITVSSIADSASVAAFQEILTSSDEFGQKILSSILKMDPFDPKPGALPVSYKLMGQRFMIDSYVFSNIVFDQITFNGEKIWRPMPDPMDAMFVLGNNNALPLLREELEQYHYSQNLAGLRYLVDSYDDEFWEKSLYNVWLNAIRALNPEEDLSGYPLMMQSAAWQQKKLNTQLASWAQLRHDNLLYTKQSYASVTGCSYPHSFIEPCPGLYTRIKDFAEKAYDYFSVYAQEGQISNSIPLYFTNLGLAAGKLKVIVEKELSQEPFSDTEVEFLQNMLYYPGICGERSKMGWYNDFIYSEQGLFFGETPVADVHTQPTDENGVPVGKVLHVGTGNFNMGFFIAPSPSNNFEPMLFTGPVMSYYELITNNYKRLTDSEWGEILQYYRPSRPDWVNVYLADKEGKKREAGRTLPSVVMTDIVEGNANSPFQFSLEENYPNPFNPLTRIGFTMAEKGHAKLAVYDLLGREVEVLVNGQRNAGRYEVVWDSKHVPSGIYFYKFEAENCNLIKKMTLVK